MTITSAAGVVNNDFHLSAAMREKHQHLCEIIAQSMKQTPFEAKGLIWAAAISQDAWCRVTGLALRTLQELVKHPPIMRYRCKIGGLIVTLLRIGHPDSGDPEEAKRLAKLMSRTYRDKTGEAQIRAAEFGMLCGLARDFPAGFQLEIFKHTVLCWPDFMDMAKFEIEAALELRRQEVSPFADEFRAVHYLTTARRLHGEELSLRTYKRPFIPLLRVLWPVAVEMFIDHREMRGGSCPESVWPRWCIAPSEAHAESTS